MMSGMGPRNRVLNRHAYWLQLANMVEQLCTTAMSVYATTGGDTE